MLIQNTFLKNHRITPPEYDDNNEFDYGLDDEDMHNEILDDLGLKNYDSIVKVLNQKMTQQKNRKYLNKIIDRMHKWRPKKYSFVYVLIRLTSLVCMYKIQKKCCLSARLVSLVST